MKKQVIPALLLLMGMLSSLGVFLFAFPFWDTVLWMLYIPVLLFAVVVYNRLLLRRRKKVILILAGGMLLLGVLSFSLLQEGCLLYTSRYSDGSLALAPVFDNGASFSTKISDEKINDMLKNEDRILSSAISTVTGYNIDGKALQFGALLKLEDKDIHNAVKRVVPRCV